MLSRPRIVAVTMGVVVLAFAGSVLAQAKPPLVIADFEGGNAKPFEGGTLVSHNATHGQGALEVRPGAGGDSYQSDGAAGRLVAV